MPAPMLGPTRTARIRTTAATGARGIPVLATGPLPMPTTGAIARTPPRPIALAAPTVDTPAAPTVEAAGTVPEGRTEDIARPIASNRKEERRSRSSGVFHAPKSASRVLNLATRVSPRIQLDTRIKTGDSFLPELRGRIVEELGGRSSRTSLANGFGDLENDDCALGPRRRLVSKRQDPSMAKPAL